MATKKISELPLCGPLAGVEFLPLVQGASTVRSTLDELPLSTAALAALSLKQDASTAATDTELASAVASLTSAIATKQNLATAATDSELAAAQASLTTAIAAVQASVDALGAAGATDAEVAAAVAALAATVATDAELAAAVSTLNAAVALKQDASTAATDAELASAVSTLTTAIGLKQDASTAATDTELAAEASTRATADTTNATAIGSEATARAAADTALDARLTTAEGQLRAVTANYQTADYTLALTDANAVIEVDSAAQHYVTIPANADVAFPVGTVIEIARLGVGLVTLSAAKNLIANPSLEVNATSWSSGGTFSRTAAAAMTGSFGARATATGAGALQIFHSGGATSLAALGLVIGDIISAACYIRTSFAAGGRLQIQFWGSSNTVLLSTLNSTAVQAQTFHRLTNRTIPASCDTLRLTIDSTASSAGDTIDADGLMLSKSPTIPAYSDTGVVVRNSATGLNVTTQYASAVLRQRAVDEWVAGGTLS